VYFKHLVQLFGLIFICFQRFRT